MAIFRSYTPTVEPLSLDEAFLDVEGSERLFGDAEEIGRRIKNDILRETRLVASVGVAPTKFLAKLASDLDKPDGFRVIQHGRGARGHRPLPVSKIFGVGPRSAKRLEASASGRWGSSRSSPSATWPVASASGVWIHDLAHGVDPRRVTARREEKSHGMERTFAEDIADREELGNLLCPFCEEVAFHLRDKGLRGRTITIKARFSDFKTVTRRRASTATNLIGRVSTPPPGSSSAGWSPGRCGCSASRSRSSRTCGSRSRRCSSSERTRTHRPGRTSSRPRTRSRSAADAEPRQAAAPFGRGAVLPATSLLRDRDPRGRDGTPADGRRGARGRNAPTLPAVGSRGPGGMGRPIARGGGVPPIRRPGSRRGPAAADAISAWVIST